MHDGRNACITLHNALTRFKVFGRDEDGCCLSLSCHPSLSSVLAFTQLAPYFLIGFSAPSVFPSIAAGRDVTWTSS